MNLFKIIFLIIFASSYIFGQNISNHIWKNRIILVKTNDSNLELYHNQLNELENSESELNERKVIIYQIENQNYKKLKQEKLSKSDFQPIIRKERNEYLEITKPFEIVLIGLDGTVKLTEEVLVSKSKILSLIDSMPMRKLELSNFRDN